jgi:hypothetical protein
MKDAIAKHSCCSCWLTRKSSDLGTNADEVTKKDDLKTMLIGLFKAADSDAVKRHNALKKEIIENREQIVSLKSDLTKLSDDVKEMRSTMNPRPMSSGRAINALVKTSNRAQDNMLRYETLATRLHIKSKCRAHVQE